MASPIPINLTTFGQLPQDYKEGRQDSALITVWGWLTFEVANSLYIPNHIELAKSRLIEQFKEYRKIGAFSARPEGINNFIAAAVASVQDVEDVVNDLWIFRSLNQAQGVQLDEIGAIVGAPRTPGESDDDYRIDIQFQIFINSSNGEPETLYAVSRFVTNTPTVGYREYWPAACLLELNADVIPTNFGTQIQAVAPAGVDVMVVNTYYDPPFTFEWDGLPITRGLGLNEKDYAPGGVEVGGRIAERIL